MKQTYAVMATHESGDPNTVAEFEFHANADCPVVMVTGMAQLIANNNWRSNVCALRMVSPAVSPWLMPDMFGEHLQRRLDALATLGD